MNTALQELVMNNRRIRFDEVRIEGRLVVSLLRSWGMIAALNPDSGHRQYMVMTLAQVGPPA